MARTPHGHIDAELVVDRKYRVMIDVSGGQSGDGAVKGGAGHDFVLSRRRYSFPDQAGARDDGAWEEAVMGAVILRRRRSSACRAGGDLPPMVVERGAR